MKVIWSWIISGSRITTTTATTTTATFVFALTISNPYFTITILYTYHNSPYLTSITTLTLRLHYHYPTPISTTTTTTTTTVTEVTFLTNHNNSLNWPNSSTNGVCCRHHGYYQLRLNLTTRNPSVLSPNSTFRQYFIYFILDEVNLKLVLSWIRVTSVSYTHLTLPTKRIV